MPLLHEVFLVLPVNFSTRINAYTMPTRSNCHTTEISTNNPVHSSSQSSDPEIHERSPNARIYIRDGDAVQKISTSAPMMGVTNDNGIDAVRAESGLIDSPTAEVAIGSVIGRSSMTAILDRMEATKFQAVRSSDKVDDSLLSCFDPLLVQSDGPSELQTHGGSVEHETSLIGSSNQCLIPNLTNNEVIPLSEHRGLQNPEDRLISPLIYDQNMQPITDTTPSTPLSTGFTPVPSAIKQLNVSVTTGSASPFVFSPWMHRSILDQAFGDGDHSPEWTEPADPDTTPPTSAPPLSVGCQLSVDPVQTKPVLPKPVQLSCLSDATEQSDLSQSYTSAVALSDAGDLDMLASLLERVNVCQDDGDSETSESAERPESEVDVLQRTPAIRIPLLRAPGTYDVNSKPHPRAVNLPTGFTPPRYVDTIETTPTVHSLHQARRRTINLSSTPNVAPVVDCANSPLMTVSEPHKSDSDCRNSGRISLGSISGMVTMAARSLYDRIGGGSSVVTRSPATTIPITNAASPVNYDSQTDIIQHAQQSPPLKQVVSPPGCRSSYLNATVNITDPSVHSVDEDVWESVNSVHELHSTMIVDTSVRDISGHSFQMSEENKENLHLSQTEISQPCYSSHQDRLCESAVSSASLDSNMITDGHSSRSFTSSRNGLHETQVTPHLTASGDGPEMLKSFVKSRNELPDLEAFVTEKQSLVDEISRLRVAATGLASILDAYERTLLDADVSERERCTAACIRVLQVAAERDEATEQALTMYKAYEDMYRRVQRAKETIEIKKERQKAAIQCIERYVNRIRTIEDKYEKLSGQCLNQLTECLTTQDRQQDEWHRKLDKLHLEVRQHELRNTTLTNEIRLKEQHCNELTMMSKMFFK